MKRYLAARGLLSPSAFAFFAMHNPPSGTVYNLLLLDESFSMAVVRETTIQGVNDLVHTLQGLACEFPHNKQLLSLTTFNGHGIHEKWVLQDVTTLPPLTLDDFNPSSLTPLLDAMGQSLQHLRQVLAASGTATDPVLVTVLTDGEENASQTYSRPQIRDLVDQLKQQGWTFTYIGANHDIELAAEGLAIDNTLGFVQSSGQMAAMFAQERLARCRYNLTLQESFFGRPPQINYFAQDKSSLVPPTPGGPRP